MIVADFKWAVCLLCLLIGINGCSDNTEDIVGKVEENHIQLFIPDAEEVVVYSSGTESENRIEDCFVVVFNSGGSYKEAEKIDVSKIAQNGTASPILPQLSFDLALNDKIYVICNTGLTTLPTGISSESDINTKFKPAKDYYYGGEALPMSGSALWTNTSKIIPVTRAVAKVEVKLGEGFNIGGNVSESDAPGKHWNMENFREQDCGFVICNYGGKSDILPPPAGFSDNTLGATAIYGTTSENQVLRFAQYANSAAAMTLYVSEYPNSTKDYEGNTIAADAFNASRCFLLMIDSVPADGGPLASYSGLWRLDFYDALSKQYIDIQRNHHYTFTINKIRSAPYVEATNNETITQIMSSSALSYEVWQNPGSNIEYSVEVNEGWADHTYSNGQYALSISTDTIIYAGLEFNLKAQIPAGVDDSQIQKHHFFIYDRENNLVGHSGSNLEVSVNGAAAPSTPQTNGFSFLADGTETTLTFTVNDYTNLDSANMHIRLGNIYKRVPIKFNPWVYMPDPGFRAYNMEKGYISEVNPSDNNYVKISSAGRAAETINLNREGYYAIVSPSYSITIGGMYASGGFSKIPNVISTANMSDVNTTLWNPVSDLTGIEAFTNLKTLRANGNDLTTMDLSGNQKLERLEAESNPLTSITFDNPELIYIDLINSQLSSIDVSQCSNDLKVLLVTGYSSLASSGGAIVGAGQNINGVTVKYVSIIASGSITVAGSWNVSMSMEYPDEIIHIKIDEPMEYSVLRKLLKEQGVDL